MKNSKSGSQNKKQRTSDPFLEAIRDLGNDTVYTLKDDLFKKGAQDIFDSLSPFKKNLPPSEPVNNVTEALPRKTDWETRARVSNLEIIHREEKILFTREQKETQAQVNNLQEEIKKLAKSTAELASEAKEAEISARQQIPLAGEYHINFFIRLRKLIASLREQIHESSLWLSAWNQRAKKRNYYWGQFKKSGSKFLLSSDRSVATQTG
jgi:hypothetical protein